jgi:hypothetical protein
VGWVRSILPMSFPCHVNGIALCASPFFSGQLRIELLDFSLIDDHNVVGNPMRLVLRFWPVLNECIGHCLCPHSEHSRPAHHHKSAIKTTCGVYP